MAARALRDHRRRRVDAALAASGSLACAPALELEQVTKLALASLAVLLSTACGSSSPPYAACVDDLDCPAPSDGCYRLRFTRDDGTEADGAMCSAGCATDDDCPEDGACLALEGDPTATFFCAQRCAVSGDCYAGSACTMVDGERTMDVCLPTGG